MYKFNKIIVLTLFISVWEVGLAKPINPPQIKVLHERGSRITIEFKLKDYEIEPVDVNGVTCSKIVVPEQITFLKKGLPELPTIARNIIIPDDALIDYRIVSIEYETEHVNTVVPSKGNLYRNVNPDDIPYTFSEFYQSDSWWPEKTIEVYKPFILRDYRGVTVRFNPFQYNPARNELKIAKRAVVEVYEKGKDDVNIITKERGAITREFVDIYKSIFLNFNESHYDSISERAGRMVIIAADAYMSNMHDFKVWKRMKGIETKMVPISAIGNTEDSIKNYIVTEYGAGDLVWVLLVGDGDEVVPATGTVGSAEDAAADPVYAYITGSDYYPDIFVSRFSSRGGNSANIDKQASRSINYEKQPREGAQWYRVGLGVASDLTGGTPFADSTRMNWLRDSLLDYSYNEVNKSYDRWGKKDTIKKYIEAGTGIINYIGHGQTDHWVNGGGFGISDLDNLDNPSMLPFVISVACVVGNFNGYDCYCEASVTAGTVEQPDGFLVHWGSTIIQSWVPPCIGQEGAVNLLTHDNNNTAGGIFFNGACYMIEYYADSTDSLDGVEIAQTWHIFGDASVQLRTRTPQSMTVNHAPSIFIGQTTFDIHVDGVESALVGLYTDTLLIGHGYTDAWGNVTIDLDPAPSQPDTMYITITAYNKIPYLDSVPIAFPEMPTIIKPLDFARLPDTQPTLSFYSIFPDDSIRYQILWDTDPAFASPESVLTDAYESGDTVHFVFPSSLRDDSTYWWKVRYYACADRSAPPYTTKRSFTIATILPPRTCSWFQTDSGQFICNVLEFTMIQDNCVIIGTPQEVAEVLLEERFEVPYTLPPGWTVFDGNDDGHQWAVGTTDAIDSFPPPDYGSNYAYYNDSAAGNGVINSLERLVSPKIYVPGSGFGDQDLTINYGYGFRCREVGEKFKVFAHIALGGGIGRVVLLATYTSSTNGTERVDLSQYMPADTVQFVWEYSDGSSSLHWGFACACDNVHVAYTLDYEGTKGAMTGVPVNYHDLSTTYARPHWGDVVWYKAAPGDSIRIQVEYCDSGNQGSWRLIPDDDLPGNATGFYTSLAVGSIDLSDLDTLVYHTIRLYALFHRRPKDAPGHPALLAWEVGKLPPDSIPPSAPYITGVEKSGDDAVLTWNTVTTDTLGNPDTALCYIVHRDTFPHFIPGSSNSIDSVFHPETTYTDSDILTSDASYYYLVETVNWVEKKSKKSNMAYVFRKFVNENQSATDKNWVSLPWHSGFDDVSDLTDDLSPSGDPLIKITHLIPEQQLFESWIWNDLFLVWLGADFGITSGCGYEMVTIIDDTVVIAGSNDPDGFVTLVYNDTQASKNWISIPYNALYDSVKDITDELSPAGDPVSKITRLDEESQYYYSWIYHPEHGWYGNDPAHENFPIVKGTGYEFVATKDTTWNPSEYSNEEAAAVLVRGRTRRKKDFAITVGNGRDPERVPVWSVGEIERVGYSHARVYTPASKRIKTEAAPGERKISHTVYADLNLKGYDNLVFTVYCPDRPGDVLTEQNAGCVMAKQGDVYRLVSFDMGNFKHVWKEDEEVIIIIEATKDSKAYFTSMTFTLNESDMQALSNEITFERIPEPTSVRGVVSWNKVDNDNVVGYSLYRDDERINERVISRNDYSTDGTVVLRPVFRGGYETVYDSRGVQSESSELIPISYAFDIYPNPFSTQTHIEYALPKQTPVDIVIYDVSGRLVRTVISDELDPGYYKDNWSGTDAMGRKLAAGVYFIQMTTDDYKIHNKVIFVR